MAGGGHRQLLASKNPPSGTWLLGKAMATANASRTASHQGDISVIMKIILNSQTLFEDDLFCKSKFQLHYEDAEHTGTKALLLISASNQVSI
jgi:hypothetical protein